MLSGRWFLAVLRIPLGMVVSALIGGMALQVRATPNPQILDSNITLAALTAAQKNWCQGFQNISAAYSKSGQSKAKAAAEAMVDQLYAYRYGPVAFKPTTAFGSQTFRPTRAGALAILVGGDPNFPNDKGFATKPWRSCEVINHVIQLNGSYANAMGNAVLTNASGKTTKLDKAWVFIREPDGSIRILLHHSSLPYGA